MNGCSKLLDITKYVLAESGQKDPRNTHSHVYSILHRERGRKRSICISKIARQVFRVQNMSDVFGQTCYFRIVILCDGGIDSKL